MFRFDDQTTSSASGPSVVTNPSSVVNSTDTQSAVTTTPSVDNSAYTQPHTPLIIGTTCGVTGLVVIFVVLLWWRHRRDQM